MERPFPVVLAGGRSIRFGRDKLREPLPGADAPNATLVIDAPIRALRDIFGPPVALVGECHPDVAARADMVIADALDSHGPIAGIVSALRHSSSRSGTFVLPGDLPFVTSHEVARLWDAARENPDSWAVLGQTDRLEPCIGLYRPDALATLEERVLMRRLSLHDAIPPARVTSVPLDPGPVRNVNRPSDLGLPDHQ